MSLFLSKLVVNKSLLYLLVFTIFSSGIAYYVIMKSYDNVFLASYYGN